MSNLLRLSACLFLCVSLNSFGGTIFGLYQNSNIVRGYDTDTGQLTHEFGNAVFDKDSPLFVYDDVIYGYRNHSNKIYGYDVNSGQKVVEQGLQSSPDRESWYLSPELKIYGWSNNSNTVSIMDLSSGLVENTLTSVSYKNNSAIVLSPNNILYGAASSNRILGYDVENGNLTAIIENANPEAEVLTYNNGLILGSSDNNNDVLGYDANGGWGSTQTTDITKANQHGMWTSGENHIYVYDGNSHTMYKQEIGTTDYNPFNFHAVLTSGTSIAYQPSPVPLPAGIYLFLSGLVGLFGVKLRG
ncbi:PQQ-like beta-propeller repeat protein [bacterium]|nr:PQQ-like beta-propeller repeat protein [bacterium]